MPVSVCAYSQRMFAGVNEVLAPADKRTPACMQSLGVACTLAHSMTSRPMPRSRRVVLDGMTHSSSTLMPSRLRSHLPAAQGRQCLGPFWLMPRRPFLGQGEVSPQGQVQHSIRVGGSFQPRIRAGGSRGTAPGCLQHNQLALQPAAGHR